MPSSCDRFDDAAEIVASIIQSSDLLPLLERYHDPYSKLDRDGFSRLSQEMDRARDLLVRTIENALVGSGRKLVVPDLIRALDNLNDDVVEGSESNVAYFTTNTIHFSNLRPLYQCLLLDETGVGPLPPESKDALERAMAEEEVMIAARVFSAITLESTSYYPIVQNTILAYKRIMEEKFRRDYAHLIRAEHLGLATNEPLAS